MNDEGGFFVHRSNVVPRGGDTAKTPGVTIPLLDFAMTKTTGAATEDSGGGAEAVSTELHERYWKRLCIFAARRLRDRSAAEDVAQETLRRVIEALRENKIEKLEALPAFVFQTARNICLHHGRSARRQEGALLRFRSGMATASDDDPLLTLVDEARAEEVRRALEQLDAGDRQLLRLLYVDGLKTSDIARRLGVDAGTLRVRKHRALKRLSDVLRNVLS
ncbi:MAG TPA: sigma-70 family RNA polymerase sigma factor [Thermoanaerobaculia bacterium]|nr:sigma-70 family RNA polymerase sigma factor [Thermoanaerobaculia bacterium]